MVAYHGGGLIRGGFVGVDVFFVISGYVITGLLLREWRRSARISLLSFYARRLRRLLPAAALSSAFTLVGAVLLLSPLGIQKEIAQGALSSAMFVSNFFFAIFTGGYFQPAAESNPYLHTWSLSVEEQFYLVLPATMALALKASRGSTKALRWVLASGAAVSLVLCVWFTFGSFPFNTLVNARLPELAFYSSFTRAWEFLAGALICTLPRLVRPRWATVVGVAGLAGLIGSYTLLTSESVFPGVWVLLPVGASAALLAAGHLGDYGVLRRLLESRALVWIGDRSYSWYLWHWPVIVFARQLGESRWILVAAAVFSLVPAALAYRLVEHPIHTSIRWNKIPAAIALGLACTTATVALGGLFWAGQSQAWGDSRIASYRTQLEASHMDSANGCLKEAPVGARKPGSCLWKVPESKGRILLIGDSHAGVLADAVVPAANALGYDAEVAVFGGCPYNLRAVYPKESCRTFNERGVAYLKQHRGEYSAIVTSSSTLSYVRQEWLADGAISSDTDLVERAAASWSDDLAQTITDVGIPTLVIGDVPRFVDFPECLRPSIVQPPEPGCGVDPGGSELETVRRVISLEQARAVTDVGARYFDAASLFCADGGSCHAIGGDGSLLFQDSGHLSVHAAKGTEPVVAREIKALLG